MPPRAVKRTPAGPGSKRGGRGGRGRTQVQPRVHSEVEEQARVEEPAAVKVKEEVLKEKTPPPPAVEEKETVAEMVSPKELTEKEPEVKSEDKAKGALFDKSKRYYEFAIFDNYGYS